jgi:hypothetical protein
MDWEGLDLLTDVQLDRQVWTSLMKSCRDFPKRRAQLIAHPGKVSADEIAKIISETKASPLKV